MADEKKNPISIMALAQLLAVGAPILAQAIEGGKTELTDEQEAALIVRARNLGTRWDKLFEGE